MRDATHVEALIPHRLPMRLVEGFEDPVDEHMLACAEVRAAIEAEGWTVVGLIPSPILGGAGAREFLIGARHE